ncbi:type II toxin-antitoxin system mRNA interferase toxin, RelE/StbE family [Patescibacteria group bacterium]|nr:type II toxin-antitoxin system mRNA interferase toxin, RelE/StbE family [Patescibacteria group bacterium]
MKIKFSKKFSKRFDKAPKKIRTAFNNRLEVFINDKFHSQLNNHSLTGRYRGHRSINVTGDWRAIFREYGGGKIAYFVTINTHSNLYK